MRVSFHRMSRTVWDKIAPLAGSSLYGSFVFAELWRTRGGKPVCWLVEQNSQVVAALPGVEFGTGPLRRFYAMPDGCYARLFLHPSISNHNRQVGRMVLDKITSRYYTKLFLFDFYGAFPTHPHFEVERRTTTLVDISDPEWQPPDKKLQSQIRKASREGIEVVDLEWDRHGTAFMELMERTAQRHGQKPHYRTDFFAALANLAARDERIRWVWCEHHGQPVCSHIYFVEGDMLQGWQMYFDKSFSFLKPNQYIRFLVCREMAAQGIRKLNLGTSPPEAEGLRYYKRRWGGTEVTYTCFTRKRGLGKFL